MTVSNLSRVWFACEQCSQTSPLYINIPAKYGVSWLIHKCGMTHFWDDVTRSNAPWLDVYVTWPSQMCHDSIFFGQDSVTYAMTYVYLWHDSAQRAMPRSICDMTQSDVPWLVLFVTCHICHVLCVTRLCRIWASCLIRLRRDVTRSDGPWLDLFVTWLIQMWEWVKSWKSHVMARLTESCHK